MDLTLLGLAAAYVLPIVGLALIATARPRISIVTSVLLTLPLFYLAHYFGLKALQGWPTDEPLPERFDLLAEQVIEPDSRAGKPGAVFLWVRSSDDERPRAYRLSYSKALHEEADQAGKRRAAGTDQRGIRVERDSNDSGTRGGQELPVRIMNRINPRPPPKPDVEAEKNRP
jgi:hypothetical protein